MSLEQLTNTVPHYYREMAELKRELATRDVQAQEQALSAEVGVQKRLEAALAEAQDQARREQSALMAQVVELQETLTQSETQANRCVGQEFIKHGLFFSFSYV